MHFDFFDMPLLYLLVISNNEIEIIFVKVLNMNGDEHNAFAFDKYALLQYQADSFYVSTTR